MIKCVKILLIISLFLRFTYLLAEREDAKVLAPISLEYTGADARRVWIGTTIPKRVQKQIIKLQEQIKKTGIKAYAESPQRLHVTLKFVGSIRPRLLDIKSLIKVLNKVPLERLNMKIRKVGLLNNLYGGPRLIWAEIDSESMQRTFSNIEESLSYFFDKEKHPYYPHITLFTFKDAQSNKPLPPRIVKAIEGIEVNIPEFYGKGFKLLETPQSAQAPFITLANFKEKYKTSALLQNDELLLQDNLGSVMEKKIAIVETSLQSYFSQLKTQLERPKPYDFLVNKLKAKIENSIKQLKIHGASHKATIYQAWYDDLLENK